MKPRVCWIVSPSWHVHTGPETGLPAVHLLKEKQSGSESRRQKRRFVSEGKTFKEETNHKFVSIKYH